MPQLSYERSEALFTELSEANKMLMSPPANVDEYISYSKFLRITVERMSEYSETFSRIKNLNIIMDEYELPHDDRAQSKFSQSLQSLTMLRHRV